MGHAHFLLAQLSLEEDDPAAAVPRLEVAVARGHVAAHLRLGLLLFLGQGVAADYHRAFSLLTVAANANSADAKVVLGLFFEEGLVVKEDADEARRLYEAAAAGGAAEAAKALARLDAAAAPAAGCGEPAVDS
jgi:hypothetical protein